MPSEYCPNHPFLCYKWNEGVSGAYRFFVDTDKKLPLAIM